MSEENNPLPFYTETLETIPEALQTHYVDDNEGGFTLNVANVAPKAKLDEFRENNRKLKAERDDLANKYSYVDLDEYKSLKERAVEDRTKGNIHEDELEKVLQARTSNMKEEYDSQLTDLMERNTKAERHLASLLIDNEVSAGATKLNVRSTALEDVMLRAKQVFKVEDGQVKAFDSDGAMLASKSGDGSMTINEWMKKLSKTAPHLFEDSVGSSAPGSKTAVTGTDMSKLSATDKIAEGLKALS